MGRLVRIAIATVFLVGCGGSQRVKSPAVETAGAPAAPAAPAAAAGAKPAAGEGASGEAGAFVLRDSKPARDGEEPAPSKITPTATEAAVRLVVIDKDKGPVEGIVISLTAPDGKKYYTAETDLDGRAEVLVPVGQKYDLVYLSLGRRDIAASVTVSDEPKQNIRLTLRYKRHLPLPPATPDAPPTPGFVLSGVTFDTGKASIRAESFARLDSVVEYMTHKPGARIEISGHTDNVGNPKINKALSERRAQACRAYLISKGIDGGRIQPVGRGDERPIAPNDTDEGRQKNRRIEATEL